MCVKTDDRIFLEEFLEHNFKGRKWNIEPFYHSVVETKGATISHQDNVFYYGELWLTTDDDLNGGIGGIVFFDREVPYLSAKLMFTGTVEFDALLFTGYRVTLDVSLGNYKS